MAESLLAATRRNATMYRRLAGARARGDLQYRSSLAMYSLGSILITGLDFAAIAILFVQVPALAGWSLAEVAFLYGTAGVSFRLADLAVGSVEKVSLLIRSGRFDALLLRPVGSLLQVVTDTFALRRVGTVVQPAAVLVLAVANLDVAWTGRNVALTATTVVAGAVIFGAIWVVTATIAFWTVEGREAANAVTYGGGFLTQYPLPIYGDVLRSLVFVIPLAFVNYLPAVAILDKVDPLGAPEALRYAAPVVAIATVVVATWTWRFAVRHYRSTGS